MAERTEINRTLLWALALVLVALSAVAIYWITFAGGVRRADAPARYAEECGVGIGGSYVLTHALAGDLVAAFLQQRGYAVGPPTPGDDGATQIVGVRGELACTIRIRTMDSTQAFDELGAGRIAVALSQRFVHDRDAVRVAGAAAADFEAERGKAETVIAVDAPAVIVNPANAVKEIPVEAIREIAIGRLVNWRGLGGSDAPIALYFHRDGTSATDFPNDSVTIRNPIVESLNERATLLATDADIIAAVARDPNAFGIVSSSFLAEGAPVHTVGLQVAGRIYTPSLEALRSKTYPLMRRLFLYVRPGDRGQAFVEQFIAFATSPAAQPLYERNGVVAKPRAAEPTLDARGCLHGTAETAAVAAVTHGARRVDPPLHFEAQSVALSPESAGQIAALGNSVRNEIAAGATLVLIGHADAIGRAEANRALAMRRALVARDAFEAQGVFGAIVESAGEMCLVKDNMTEGGRRTNQRVEVWLRPAPGAATGG
jgi:phosphate transport system substrate-binding protein